MAGVGEWGLRRIIMRATVEKFGRGFSEGSLGVDALANKAVLLQSPGGELNVVSGKGYRNDGIVCETREFSSFVPRKVSIARVWRHGTRKSS